MRKKRHLICNEAAPIQSLTFNLDGPIRNETLEGREYIVAPMVMITEGVHNGTGGALYYPEVELSKFPEGWNHKPIVVYHPQLNGQGVSACDPVVLNTRKVGVVLNTQWDSKTKKLRSEAWIEVSRANTVDTRVMEFLEKKKVMEVSTGLYTENEESSGTFNGKDYVAIARNYRPDHLALLPDKKGACSIEDGAGLFQLNEGVDSKLLLNQKTSYTNGLFPTLLLHGAGKVFVNELSHSAVYSALCTALREKYGKELFNDDYLWDGWIEDVYDTSFVYWNDGKLWRMGYLATDTKVSLVGDPEQVVRVTDYKVVTTTNSDPSSKEIDMKTKKEKVDFLIGNADSGWVEVDREHLDKTPDAALDKIVANAEVSIAAKKGAKDLKPAPIPAPVVNSDPPPAVPAKPQTPEEYIANAPAGVREVLMNSVSVYNAEKGRLVDAIVANKQNRFSKEFLMMKDITELQGLAALAAVPTQQTATLPSYFGSAGTPPTGNVEEEAPLLAPSMATAGK